MMMDEYRWNFNDTSATTLKRYRLSICFDCILNSLEKRQNKIKIDNGFFLSCNKDMDVK